MIFITEQKNDAGTGIHAVLYTKDRKIYDLGIIPRPDDPKFRSTGTWSVASNRATKGEFFTYGQPQIFRSQTKTYLWRFRPTTQSAPDPHNLKH